MKGKEVKTEASIEDWMDNMLSQAVENSASDVHIDPARKEMQVRFRIDGFLYEFQKLPMDHHEGIISKIKVLSKLDITKHRIPQDGHFEFEHQGRTYNVRVSTYPTIYGEDAVMRILDREGSLIELEGIGFGPEQLVVVKRLLEQPYGMIMLTGPSGSGKTTFIYSMLNHLNKEGNNVISVEDPVEIEVDGMRQTQVGEFQEMTFAIALRSILRQDPDILMVGEIRDEETAEMTMQAALTGRLVFSTFHTLDMFAVIHRLIEMQIPRSVTAHAFLGIISTRLVRKICDNCKTEYKLSDREIELLDRDIPAGQVFYKGRGCKVCNDSGYKSRVGIFEVVPFDNAIRDVIINKPNATAMEEVLRAKGIKNLYEAGMDKVMNGITTVDEVVRVTGTPLYSKTSKNSTNA